jgi:uracil-DNA glycosylase
MDESFAALLRWYIDMGVDIAVDDASHDRFAESCVPAREKAPADRAWEEAAAARRRPEPKAVAPMPAADAVAAMPAAVIAAGAAADAAAAKTLEDLRKRLRHFEGCGLKAAATQLVFGDGSPSAKIMFIGEAPGADEDRQGVPFVGRAGRLLDKMLSAIGLDRSTVYIANVVPWRPPGNRTPTPVETAACLPFTRRQIELIDPKILVCLGAPSAQTLLGGKDGILRMRGRWHTYRGAGKEIPALAMLHPAYLLRQPSQKKLAWQDLRLLAKEITRLGLLAKVEGES